MLKEKAGSNAGVIWKTLDAAGEMQVKDLKKKTKLKDKELYLSLGWLLKEDKIEISGQEPDFSVMLK